MFLPAKTPRAIIEKLHDEAVKALATPKLQEKLVALGVAPMVMTPTEFDGFIEKQITADAALVKTAGIKTH